MFLYSRVFHLSYSETYFRSCPLWLCQNCPGLCPYWIKDNGMWPNQSDSSTWTLKAKKTERGWGENLGGFFFQSQTLSMASWQNQGTLIFTGNAKPGAVVVNHSGSEWTVVRFTTDAREMSDRDITVAALWLSLWDFYSESFLQDILRLKHN